MEAIKRWTFKQSQPKKEVLENEMIGLPPVKEESANTKDASLKETDLQEADCLVDDDKIDITTPVKPEISRPSVQPDALSMQIFKTAAAHAAPQKETAVKKPVAVTAPTPTAAPVAIAPELTEVKAEPAEPSAEDKTVKIKKYANRRLYNTTGGKYVTQKDIADMLQDGAAIEVVDAKTGDDITHSVLVQIMLDKNIAQDIFSTGFLRAVLAVDDAKARALAGHLEKAAKQFDR